MKPRNTNGMSCPLWRKPCVKVCHTCEFWDHIRGRHPQTGQDVDHWACTMKMHTMLQIEHTLAARQTTASVDELRKEVHANADTALMSAVGVLNQKMDASLAAPSQKLIEN